MTTFLTALTHETGQNLTRTENGAVTNKSTLDPVLDFFALAGAMRDRPETAADLFEAAFNADPQTAVRVLFYLRDVRGGQGEREVFYAGLRRLEAIVPTWFRTQAFEHSVLAHVPFYGRWDDLFYNGVTPQVTNVIHQQLQLDLLALKDSPGPVSLLAKWLPSENAGKASKELARTLRKQMGMSSWAYRNVLTRLRRRIHLLEQDMSANNWDEIDFEKLPSQAHRKHVKALYRHLPEKYGAYIDAITNPPAAAAAPTMNMSTVYPYEIYDMVMKGGGAECDAMWQSLPDYTDGKDALVVADVSGSMYGRPMSVSVSLALYFANRNTGAFKDHFMTFSNRPQLVKVQGTNLRTQMAHIEKQHWSMNTDLMAAFRAILHAAITSQSAPPAVLYIVSDMEFDQAVSGGRNETLFKQAQRQYAQAGFELPHVVFWNVNARNVQTPATILDQRVTLVSGCSPTIFSMAVENKTPRELMDTVVNGERYSRIIL